MFSCYGQNLTDANNILRQINWVYLYRSLLALFLRITLTIFPQKGKV